MKKLSIVLLCVLLAFSFVSCEKDKSGDMITNYENFIAGYAGGRKTFNLFSEVTATGADINTDLKDKSITNISPFVKYYLNNDDITVEYTDVKFSAGTIKGTISGTGDIDLVFTDVKFTATYTEEGETEGRTKEFTINGTYVTSESEEAKTESEAYNFVVNEKTYDVSFIVNTETEKYSSAKVNGNDVEVRLLNAMLSLGF